MGRLSYGCLVQCGGLGRLCMRPSAEGVDTEGRRAESSPLSRHVAALGAPRLN